jgi:hypothetical protein
VRALLEVLWTEGTLSPGEVLSQLHPLLTVRDEVSRLARLGHLAMVSFFPLIAVSGLLVVRQARAVGLLFLAPFIPFALLAVVATVMAKGGPLLWLFGMAVQRADGAPAGTTRCLARSLLAWSPVLLAALLLFGIGPWIRSSLPERPAPPSAEEEAGSDTQPTAGSRAETRGRRLGVRIAPGIRAVIESPALTLLTNAAAILFVLGAVLAIVQPGEGLQDRLAGTRLVPR